jgi:hypothetical protein
MNKIVNVFNELSTLISGPDFKGHDINIIETDKEFMKEWISMQTSLMLTAYSVYLERRLETVQLEDTRLETVQLEDTYFELDQLKTTPTRKTLVLHNLPRRVKVGDTYRDISTRELIEIIRSSFKQYGIILDIYLPLNKDTNSSYKGTMKGFALVKFKLSADAYNAYDSESNKLYIYNNLITVEFAKEERERLS